MGCQIGWLEKIYDILITNTKYLFFIKTNKQYQYTTQGMEAIGNRNFILQGISTQKKVDNLPSPQYQDQPQQEYRQGYREPPQHPLFQPPFQPPPYQHSFGYYNQSYIPPPQQPQFKQENTEDQQLIDVMKQFFSRYIKPEDKPTSVPSMSVQPTQVTNYFMLFVLMLIICARIIHNRRLKTWMHT